MRALGFLLLAALLAGCATPPTPTAESEPAPAPGAPEADAAPVVEPAAAAPAGELAAATPAPVPLTQSGCSSFYSAHEVDPAFARERLPEGLEPYMRDLGALFTLKAWSCEEGEVGGVPIGAARATVYYLAVVPEGAYDADHVGFSWYPLDIVTDSPALRDAFLSWGFDASEGDVAIEWNEGFDPWLVRVSSPGVGDVDATITVPSFGEEDGSFVVRYFAGRDGEVTGGVDIVVHPGARGGNGPTLLRLTGPHAPTPGVLPGLSSFQGWDEGELSYTWTGVAFP